MRSSLLGLPLLVLALTASGCARAASGPSHEAQAESRPAAPVTVLPNPALAQAGGVSIADIAERVLPSVVNISLTKTTRTHSPFPFSFGPQDGERREQGMGSGVVVGKDGTILTNNHVVADASEIKVVTYDKREFTATVVGTDPKSDLAVIRVKGNATGLTPIEFGDSSRLRLGDVVLAIGNPFGVGQTVTMGIVSAKGRADLGIVDYEDFIQTDAAINPGNSGGALVNMEGQLVGINTAILSRSGGYQGVGFAIPTNMASPIMASLNKNGRVVRGWLGVGIQDVDGDIASAMKLPGAAGVLISDVRSGGPAARSGLRRGDVVVKLDGRDIHSVGEFRNAVAAAGARQTKMEIYREGKRQDMQVELAEMPNEDGTANAPTGAAPAASSSLDGLTLEDLNAENRRGFEVPSAVQGGVVITRVDPRGSAVRSGLRPGDVLLEVNRTPVDNLAKFKELYSKAKGNVLLLVNRRGNTLFLVVRR
jgi:serine protease Do